MSKQSDKHYVYVQYYLTEYGGEMCEGEEDFAYPNYEPLHKEHHLIGVFSYDTPPQDYRHYNEQVGVDFEPVTDEPVYLVIVTYQTGSTFGYSTGNVSIVGVYPEREQAEVIARSIRTGTYKGYQDWDGYFERLEEIHVTRHILDVQSGVRKF